MAPDDPVAQRFGENVRHSRERAGMSQKQLAFRTSLHHGGLGLIERGKRLPGIDALIQLAVALEVAPEELLVGTNFQRGQSGDTKMIAGGEPSFDWEALVPHVIHPVRVAMIETFGWIGEPLSATDFEKIFASSNYTTSNLSYHLGKLTKAGVLVKVDEEESRGSVRKFYFFPQPE